ncbi:F-BAR domain only protein 2-like isoform X2 [Liolophura sinensis]|uniref:F-BAR domain only protein 2-like isoform X2 n=1 Tax=Liolophura sinensis TaxID=3198878 RepID=UPI0031595F5A
MTTFADNFWGEKNNGFYVLYTNMKHGQTSSKELVDFLRESCAVEETYSKLLSKLAKIASNSSQVGTFSPFWSLLKMLTEKLSSLHMQLVHTWSDLIKDIIRYHEEQHKKHKSVKESEAGTIEAVHSIQQTTAALHKSKEIYHTRCLELERLKRENASQKDLEKAESKYKKASDEYKSYVEKYASVRNEFESKMIESCRNFQELEETHVCQMKDFIDTYAKAWENEHALRGQVQQEFKSKCDTDLCVQKLLETFIKAKSTGVEKPGAVQFEEPDLSNLPVTRPLSPEPNDKRDSFSEKKTTGFLKGSKAKKKEKKKEKKKKDEKSDDKDNESMDAASSQDGHEGNSYEVDDEGYRIRPDNPLESNTDNGDKNSWYSSSDSESVDGEGKKIKVEIRPLSPNGAMPSGTVEDIRASVEALRLSPTTTKRRSQTPVDKMKRSQSVSDTLDCSKPSQDLLNLDLFPASSASTPTGGNYTLPSPLSPTVDTSATSSVANTPAHPTNLEDLFNHSGPTSPIGPKLPPMINSHSPLTGFPAPPLARPSSRNKSVISTQATARPAGRISPAPLMSRSDSSGSVTFNTTTSLGSSRGPSPLTLGMADSIPLAVAFTETVNAYFKGTDAKKCMVRTTGALMMSFPAGIVKVFTENPSPAALSFRVKSQEPLEQVLVNKELVTEDTVQSSSEGRIYSFEMSSLTEHLKHQGEQNKTASYFNIDILKYQVKTKPGVESTPLPLISYWKCEPTHTEYRLDYRFNSSCVSGPCTLKNITVAVTVDGGVTSVQSIPPSDWNPETKRARWKLNDISDVSEEGSQGCLRAKFSLTEGPSTPSTTALQFTCEGATLSGVDFELLGPGYRLSLSKKRFASGKYLVDPEPGVKYV